MRLQGKAVLVTGGARRVGRAIAVALAARGARLAIHYHRSRRQAQRLADELEESFGHRPATLHADLRSVPQITRLVDAAARHLGGLDVLINNASVYEQTRFGSTSEREWDVHLDANLKAPFFLAQAAARLMKKGGRIINLADWAAHRPYAGYIPYCVSKAGLICLNKALAKALAPRVLVNAISPGPVLLPESATARQRRVVKRATLIERLGAPEDVARGVVYLLEDGDFITGAELTIDGGRLIA